MATPSVDFECLICGNTVSLPSTELAEGVLSFPQPRCQVCHGFPLMTQTGTSTQPGTQGHSDTVSG